MKVLIAVDTSECAEAAFNFYFLHCHKNENEIFVVHEVEQPKLPTSSYNMGGGGYFPEEDVKCAISDHQQKCHELKQKFIEKCAGIKDLNYKVLVGATSHKPGHGLVEQAENLGVDMIVVGTCGRGAFKRKILGSVSDCVLHHSKIPVMICHK